MSGAEFAVVGFVRFLAPVDFERRDRPPAHHSGVPSKTRRRLLSEFGNGSIKALTAAQTLNEGINVLAADLGIFFGGASQRRQMVQRLGRILRLKAIAAARVADTVGDRRVTSEPIDQAHSL